MAFTTAQKLDHYYRCPEKRRVLMARWRANKRRRAEIEAAKHILLSAERLRAVGINLHSFNPHRNFDSWALRP